MNTLAAMSRTPQPSGSSPLKQRNLICAANIEALCAI